MTSDYDREMQAKMDALPKEAQGLIEFLAGLNLKMSMALQGDISLMGELHEVLDELSKRVEERDIDAKPFAERLDLE